MLILFGRANSSNVMKVIWLLEELGIRYDRRDVGGPFGGTDTPQYRAINPVGLVPGIDDEGFALFESNAITRYICNAHAPHSSLYPIDPKQRGMVDAWQDFVHTALGRPHGTVFQGLIRQRPEQRDNVAITAAVTEAGRIWGIVDERLGRQGHIAGDDFTIADIAFGPHVHRWFAMPIERPAAPHLRRWYDGLLGRPAYAEHCAGPLT